MQFYQNNFNEQKRTAQGNKKAKFFDKIHSRVSTAQHLSFRDTGMMTVKRITRGGVDIMVKKPNIVLNYIKYMGGVDRADQYASTYCFLRKSLKWWRKLFFGV